MAKTLTELALLGGEVVLSAKDERLLAVPKGYTKPRPAPPKVRAVPKKPRRGLKRGKVRRRKPPHNAEAAR